MAVLSADNPRYPAEMQGEDALRAELDRLGLDYEPTKGKYGAPERSYIVTNPDLPVVLNLGRRFGQESVAYTENGRHQLHFVNGPQAGMATAPSEKHQWYKEEPQDNYTAVPSPNGDPWGYFTWNIDFNSPMVPSGPTPMTQAQVAPMAKSESPLLVEVRKWAEALGELRTRELAKAEQVAPHQEPGIHEKSGQPHTEPGIHERPMSKSIHELLKHQVEVELRKVAPPGFSEETMHELKRKHGTESAFKIAWAQHNKMSKSAAPVTDSDAYFHPSEKGSPSKPKPAGPPAVNTYRAVPRDYRKAQCECGQPGCMWCGKVKPKSNEQGEHGGGPKQSAAYNAPKRVGPGPETKKAEANATANVLNPTQPGREGSKVNVEPSAIKKPDWQPLGTAMKKTSVGDAAHIRAVRDAENKELANIPMRDPSKGAWPKDRGVPVPSIAEERKMGKSESSKTDPLDADMARQKQLCKMCKGEMSPVEAALRRGQGHLRCEKMAKGELKYHNNEPHYQDHLWQPRCEEPVKAPGSGGDIRRAILKASGGKAPGQTLTKGSLEAKLGTGSKDHIQAQAPVGTNMPMGKAEGMPVPAAPKPPQAPGAKPSMAGGMAKALGEPELRGGRTPAPPKPRPATDVRGTLIRSESPLHKAIGEFHKRTGGRFQKAEDRRTGNYLPGGAATALLGLKQGQGLPKDPGPAPVARSVAQVTQDVRSGAEPMMEPVNQSDIAGGAWCDGCEQPIPDDESAYIEGWSDDPDKVLCQNCAPPRIAATDRGSRMQHGQAQRKFQSVQTSRAVLGNEVDQAVEGAVPEGDFMSKAIYESSNPLRKADIGGLGASMRQASFAAGAGAPTGIPAVGKVQPKSPGEYGAAAFRPASPGAAGAPAPSGLELDTSKKNFAPGFKPAGPDAAKGGPGMAPHQAIKAAIRPGGKPGTPIARIPLSKPKV